ncbi:reverse transcriptase domain-containing protein [Tanacetum coccineum]
MSTRSTSYDLVSPLSNPESVIRHRRRNLGEPSLLVDFKEINMNPNNIQGPPPVVDIVSVSLEGAARTWLEKEPLNSITTWNDLVSKFVNQFFPPSRTTNLRNEITRFQQRFGETFSEACDRFKDLLNKFPHHGLSHLHKIDTFCNGLSQSDQDSLNSGAGGNLLTRNTQEALTIIENKSKAEALGKHISSMNKPIHSIQDSCDSCGGPHSSYECQAINNMNQEEVYAYSGILAKALQERPQGALPSDTVSNPRGEIKAITTHSGIVLAGPSVLPPPLSFSSKEINLMPLSVWKKLNVPQSVPTRYEPLLAQFGRMLTSRYREDVLYAIRYKGLKAKQKRYEVREYEERDPMQSLDIYEAVVMQNDRNALRSGALIGGWLEMTKLPLPLGGYINQQTLQEKCVR